MTVLDDDHIERQLRLELDLVQRREIGGIRNGYGQAVATLAQREHTLGADKLLVDDVAWQLLKVERRKIEHRVPERFGGELRHARRRQPGYIRCVDQLIDELRIGLCRFASKILGTIWPQLALLDERTRETR